VGVGVWGLKAHIAQHKKVCESTVGKRCKGLLLQLLHLTSFTTATSQSVKGLVLVCMTPGCRYVRHLQRVKSTNKTMLSRLFSVTADAADSG
jgi:hypothetical protein